MKMKLYFYITKASIFCTTLNTLVPWPSKKGHCTFIRQRGDHETESDQLAVTRTQRTHWSIVYFALGLDKFRQCVVTSVSVLVSEINAISVYHKKKFIVQLALGRFLCVTKQTKVVGALRLQCIERTLLCGTQLLLIMSDSLDYEEQRYIYVIMTKTRTWISTGFAGSLFL